MPIILVKDKKYFTLNPNINSHTNRYIAQGRTKDALDHVRLIQNTKPLAQIMIFRLVSIKGRKWTLCTYQLGSGWGPKSTWS